MVEMKGEENNVDSERKAKKIKKSINIPDPDDITKLLTNVQKKREKHNVSKSKEEKRGKFEKSVIGQKYNNLKQKSAIKLKKSDTSVKSDVTNEKPDWLQLKKEKKELKEKRRLKRHTDTYDVSVKAKKIGEKLRRSDCTLEERQNLTSKLYELLTGQCNKIVFTHDMSRIIQWLIKYSDSEIRQAILTELKPSLVLMFQSKYAKNCIKSLLKYGSEEIKKDIVSACYGSIVKLVSHSVSVPVFEQLYSTCATETDKTYFKQEFYGDLYKHAKDAKIKTLSDVLQSSKDMKLAILTAIKGNLIKILNKKLINSSLLHTVIYEYMSQCSVDDRAELIVMLRTLITDLSKTKDGAKSSILCIWHGTNKDRKFIMKSIKEVIAKISLSEHGHLILLALMDSVDDTVLMKKIILPEIENNLTEISLNEYGKRVVLYLVARRDPHYFHPSTVQFLKQGDGNATSKKLAEIREKELLEAVINTFLQKVASEASVWLSNSSIAMVTLAILKAGRGKNLEEAYNAIVDFITDSDSVISEDGKEYKAIEHSGLHLMLKKLIQHKKSEIETTFGQLLVNRLNDKLIKQWIEYNRGCFLLVMLLENEHPDTIASLESKIKPLSASLGSKTTTGAKILFKKIRI
ncbi:pumilio homolog 3 [Orussus abietinus]|uniref:pumilio homolog 3 n=1 Tax=Orussus abietinus TaxID=222816 RepID=UPI0006266E3C|nr:pumilio homolog 3 [Orussus abietinus]